MQSSHSSPNSTSGTTSTVTTTPSERMISQLLLAFVDRRVNPQTIADVVRAQIHETKASPDAFSRATCNGILEVLTTSLTLPDAMDILVFFSSHGDFPRFLSGKAAAGGLTLALRRAQAAIETPDGEARRKYLRLVEGLAASLLVHLEDTQRPMDRQERVRLTNFFKSISNALPRALSALPVLTDLRNVLGRPASLPVAKAQSTGPTPQETIALIAQEPDHVLAMKGVQAYRLPLASQRESWRLRNVELLLETLGCEGLTDFQYGFFAEWFFDGALRDVLHDDRLAPVFTTALQSFFAEQGNSFVAIKGLLRALQKDLSLLTLDHASVEATPRFQYVLAKAGQIFSPLLSLVESDPSAFARTFATWALQIPVTPPESRLFTRAQWQWLRVLATGTWEEDLKEAPSWVLADAGRHAAQLFGLAPHFWLQEYGGSVIDRLHAEATAPSFVLARHHFDYVEYLVRTLRKKSPAAACRPETLYALKLLSRLQPHEEQQLQLAETRARMARRRTPETDLFLEIIGGTVSAESRGGNAIARALWALQRCTQKSTSRTGRNP